MELDKYDQKRLDDHNKLVRETTNELFLLRHMAERDLARCLDNVGGSRGDKLKAALHCCHMFAYFSRLGMQQKQSVSAVMNGVVANGCYDASRKSNPLNTQRVDKKSTRLSIQRYSVEFDPKEFERQCEAARELGEYFNTTAELIDELYNRAVILVKSCIEAYDRKEALCGEREAISILKVWLDKGMRAPDDSTGDRGMTFGWSRSAASCWVEIKYRVRDVIRMVRIGDARGIRPGRGQAPSYKAGYELFAEPTKLSQSQRRQVMVRRYANKYRAFSCPRWAKEGAIVVLKAMRVAKNNRRALVSARWIEKHFIEDTNGVPTIITGEPVRCEGNDYKVPCTYKTGGEWVDGYLLIRRGWRGAYHTEDGTMTDRQISRQLDLSASGGWYSARDVGELIKQRAATLRACRSRDEVRLKDSYAVGNCHPGTAAFCETLGINVDVINGRELAKLWRKAKYPELNLFSKIFRQSPVAV